MTELTKIQAEITANANPEKAVILQRFFKTGAGQYGEGDKFLGLVVPICRKISKKYYKDLSLNSIEQLLHSPWHEERQIALFMLVLQFDKADADKQKHIFDLFLNNTRYINNWDLVDCNTPRVVGRYIYEHQQLLPTLDKLADSNSLWERRIAILSTMYFTVIGGDPTPTLRIVKKLLTDNHDLIQKANGWMLREVGKRIDETILIDFLRQNYDHMPRTTLRYAIEKFKPAVRTKYLAGNFN
ncbi:MAG: DNA alkylation repair protein [Candidatus Saccharibacteria bacterium]